jgi:hypothetical protein
LVSLNRPAMAWLGVLGVLAMSSARRSSSSGDGPSSPSPAPGDRDASMRAAAVGFALQAFARVNAPGAPPADPAEFWAVAAEKPLTPAEVKNLDWCGGFYLCALKVAGIAPPSVYWRFDGSGIGSAKLQPTRNPKPADLAYFTKNQHHALIESVDGDSVHLINGNGGGKGITRTTVRRSDVAGFFSVEPLIARSSGGANA